MYNKKLKEEKTSIQELIYFSVFDSEGLKRTLEMTYLNDILTDEEIEELEKDVEKVILNL